MNYVIVKTNYGKKLAEGRIINSTGPQIEVEGVKLPNGFWWSDVVLYSTSKKKGKQIYLGTVLHGGKLKKNQRRTIMINH